MAHQAIGAQAAVWLEPAGRRLRRAVDRSTRLRLVLLGVTSLAGALLVMSPGIILVSAIASAVYLSNHIQGPLDWFMVEALGALSLFAGFISYQLLMMKPSRPDGIELTTEREPALFAMLKRRMAHFRSGAIDRVVLCTDAQLRIDATPRVPLPFFHSCTLCVGAPLLFFLSQGQFRLALAGAIGENVLGRSGLSGWIIQSSKDWPAIAKTLEFHTGLASRILIRPVRWISSVTTMLGKELNTDLEQAQGRWVLDNADEQTAVGFLASQVVACAFLEKVYWPMIYKAAHRSASPVVHPFRHLPLLLTRLLDTEQPKRWLLQAQAGSDVKQAGLRDILASFNVDRLSWPGLPQEGAFDSVFRSPELLKELDKHWQRNIETDWKRRYNSFQQDRKRFERLHQEAGTGTLQGDSAARYVKLAKRFLDKPDVVSACLGVYHSNPNDAGLCMQCGQELLLAGAAGEGYTALQRASELEPALASRAQKLMKAHKESWLDERQPAAKQARSA